jgi:hypothetical protein
MAPAVIYMDKAEEFFTKPKKKEKDAWSLRANENTENNLPSKVAKLKKNLFGQIRALKPSDQVLVVANSSNPNGNKERKRKRGRKEERTPLTLLSVQLEDEGC